MLRALGWCCFGVVIGFMLGGVEPSLERSKAEHALAVAKAECERSAVMSAHSWFGPVLPGLDRGLAAPGAVPVAPNTAPGRYRPEIAGAGAGAAAPAGPVVRSSGAAAGAAAARSTAPKDERYERLRGFDAAETAQKARNAQSREALLEHADFDAAERERLTALLRQMNTQLADYGEELIQLYLSERPPAPGDMLAVGHEVSGVLLEAQRGLDELLGDRDRTGLDDSAQQVWNYVDLSVFRPAVEAALRRVPAGVR